MDKVFISKLEQLPRMINITMKGKSILFIHYHIESIKFDEHISKDPFSHIVNPSLENLTNLFKENKDDFICFGHHHQIHFFEGDNTIFLNPGSLGCNSKPTAPYAIVNIENDK